MTRVLDAWAVVAYLNGQEPAATRVAFALRGTPVMSWINLGEVHYVVNRAHGAQEADAVVRDLRPRLALEAPTPERVVQAARLKAEHRLSYADAFAAATAMAAAGVLLTGDPELLADGAPWKADDLR